MIIRNNTSSLISFAYRVERPMTEDRSSLKLHFHSCFRPFNLLTGKKADIQKIKKASQGPALVLFLFGISPAFFLRLGLIFYDFDSFLISQFLRFLVFRDLKVVFAKLYIRAPSSV